MRKHKIEKIINRFVWVVSSSSLFLRRQRLFKCIFFSSQRCFHIAHKKCPTSRRRLWIKNAKHCSHLSPFFLIQLVLLPERSHWVSERGLRSKKTWIWTMIFLSYANKKSLDRQKIRKKTFKGLCNGLFLCSGLFCVLNDFFYVMCITK